MMAPLVLLYYVHLFCVDVERCEEFTEDLLLLSLMYTPLYTGACFVSYSTA